MNIMHPETNWMSFLFKYLLHTLLTHLWPFLKKSCFTGPFLVPAHFVLWNNLTRKPLIHLISAHPYAKKIAWFTNLEALVARSSSDLSSRSACFAVQHNPYIERLHQIHDQRVLGTAKMQIFFSPAHIKIDKATKKEENSEELAKHGFIKETRAFQQLYMLGPAF